MNFIKYYDLISKKKKELDEARKNYRKFLEIELTNEIIETLNKHKDVGIIFLDEFLLEENERKIMLSIIKSLLKSDKYIDPEKYDKEFHYAEEWSFKDGKYELDKKNIIETWNEQSETEQKRDHWIKKPEKMFYYIFPKIDDEGIDLPYITEYTHEYINWVPSLFSNDKWSSHDDGTFTHYPTIILSK